MAETKPQDECLHEKIMPENPGDEAFFAMTAGEAREHYPRFFGACPDCGWEGILYCSYAQYIAGDY